jgi:RecA-family ATPase
MERLYATVKAQDPVVVVLDPMRELHGQREDSADDMGPLLRPLRQLAHETNTAVSSTTT